MIPKPLLEESSIDDSLNPVALVFLFYLVTALVFSPLAKNKSPIKKMSRPTIILLLILGLVESAGTLSYSIGLSNTSATNASILGNGETIFAILIGLIIFRERLNRKEILPFLLIIVGSIFVPVSSDIYNHGFAFSDFVFGDMMILLAGFFYCLDTFIAKRINTSINTKRIVQVMSISGTIFAFSLLLIFNIPLTVNLTTLSIISVVGVFGLGFAALFFVIALRLIGAVRTVLIYSANTVFGIIYSGIYLGESITLTNLSSLGIIVFGLYILRTRLGSEEC